VAIAGKLVGVGIAHAAARALYATPDFYICCVTHSVIR
jgi:hypothetical protein